MMLLLLLLLRLLLSFWFCGRRVCKSDLFSFQLQLVHRWRAWNAEKDLAVALAVICKSLLLSYWMYGLWCIISLLGNRRSRLLLLLLLLLIFLMSCWLGILLFSLSLSLFPRSYLVNSSWLAKKCQGKYQMICFGAKQTTAVDNLAKPRRNFQRCFSPSIYWNGLSCRAGCWQWMPYSHYAIDMLCVIGREQRRLTREDDDSISRYKRGSNMLRRLSEHCCIERPVMQ